MYAVSDVVLSLAAKPESFGRTVLEPLSLGVPVIGYDHGGVGEILHTIFPQGAVKPHDLESVHQVLARFCAAAAQRTGIRRISDRNHARQNVGPLRIAHQALGSSVASHSDPKKLIDWLHHRDVPYAVLRDITDVSEALRGHAPLRDIDLLIDDRWIPEVRSAMGRDRRLTKIDLYGVRGEHGSDYHGFAHLPQTLGERILARRTSVEQGFYSPSPEDELDALLYHLTYHKNTQSGLDAFDARLTTPSVSLRRIDQLCDQIKQPTLTHTHHALHEYLAAKSLGVSEQRLVRYLQHDFRYQRKSYFHAWLQNQHPGELNLFVIRAVAVRRGFADALQQKLNETYQVMVTKPIDWWTRWRTRAHMRGGKWRRGGPPHVAVVVFDKHPTPTTDIERKTHPFVFNATQFAKVEWRRWFVQASGARDKDNPIHSTDNEAEAIGHLPLFFDRDEQAEIFAELGDLRRRVTDAGR